MPVPSLSDLSRQHLDADNLARLFDDTLAATTPRGKAKPTLDPAAAKNRFEDLARQVQGMALTNKDNEELKILSDLSADLTSGKPFGKSLGMFRKKYAGWKKQKDSWYREAQEKSRLKEEIESTFGDVAKEADKSQKLLKDETGKLDDVADKDALKGFESTSSGLRSAVAGHTKKIESIKKQLEDKNLKLNELEDLKKQLTQEISKAKEVREKFTNDSKAYYQKISSKVETTKESAKAGTTEETEEVEEEQAEKPEVEIEEDKEEKGEEKNLEDLIRERQEVREGLIKHHEGASAALNSVAFNRPEFKRRVADRKKQELDLKEKFNGLTAAIERETGVNLTETENLLSRRQEEINRKNNALRQIESLGDSVDPEYKQLVTRIRELEEKTGTNENFDKAAFQERMRLNDQRIKLEGEKPERRAYERASWSVSDAETELRNINGKFRQVFGTNPESVLSELPGDDVQATKQLLKIAGTAAVTATASATTQVTGQVTATAQVTPPSVSAETNVTVEGKIGRAAASRSIPITAEVTATAVISAAVASGATQAVQWFESHKNLTTEQIVTQARQDIQVRTARETEASFTGRGELAQAKAENIGFARGIGQQMAAKGRQTNDLKMTVAASEISEFAEQTARQAPTTLETPGAKAVAPGTFWQPEELEAIDRGWDEIETQQESAQAIAAPLPAALAAGGGAAAEKISTAGAPGPGRAPRPTPRVAAPTPMAERLPPGVSLAREPLRLPPSQPGSRRAAGAPSEGAGGDTPVTDQSIGLNQDQARPSVLDQGSPTSAGSYAQGESFGPPMAGEGEIEEPGTTGGGTFGEAERAAQLETQRSRDKMRTAERFMAGAGGATAGAAAGGWESPYSQENLPPEEGWDTGEEEDLGAQGQSQQGGGALDQGKQMIEDKIKEKLEKEVKQQVEKMMKQAMQKTTQQAASSGARVTTEIAEGANTPDSVGITLAIMIVQMNIQMFLKYILKAGKELGVDASEAAGEQIGEGAGKAASVGQDFLEQTFIEDALTIFLDLNLICMTNPCCWVILLVMLIFFAVIAGTDKDVQAMLGFV